MTQDRFKLDGTLAVIGGGRMGEAIISGLLSAQAVRPGDVVVAEPVVARRGALESEYGIRVTDDVVSTASEADVLLLAVKPQVIDAVLASISASVGNALVVSIAAGISCARLESALPAGSAVVRVMPNTPAMVGAGMSVVSGGAEASDEQVAGVCELFGLLGRATVLPEKHQNIATAISGSGPAYVALFVDALTRAGVRQGLTREDAQMLAVQTVAGTAALLDESGMHPEQLVDGVASPGGTTIAAIEALEDNGFRSAVSAAVAAAVQRADELGA